MSSSPSQPSRAVLRGSSGYWLGGVTAAIMIVLLGDAALRGAWDVVGVALPWMALILWAMYLVLIRPAIVVERELLRVVNPFTTHDIAWESIRDFQTKFQLTIVLIDGRRIGVWGGPAVKVGRPRVGRRNAEPAALADEVILDTRAALGPRRSAPLSATHSAVNISGIIVTFVLVIACGLTIAL